MRTTAEAEFLEQARWHFLPGEEGRLGAFYRELLANEFRAPAELEELLNWRLAAVVGRAAAMVPFYAECFARLGLAPADVSAIGDLPRLPVLTKSELLLQGTNMLAKSLPAGESIYGWFSSSGTTGKPAKVLYTVGANLMFTLLAQRQYRWYRFDPMARFASIRLSSQLPLRTDRSLLPNGETLEMNRWRYAGTVFHTGPYLCFNVENPVEEQLRWIEDCKPDYLQSYSESLEHLALACEGNWRGTSVQKLTAISEQLTPSMKALIEATLGAPVVQSYGLNEAGLVAVRCEAGSYHWHVEHCVVEVVDAQGRPCRGGEVGRLLVTTLSNPAMPLLRYDTGDMAETVVGPCPCGRTLPAFGNITGRYSRIAWLPEGSLQMAGVLRGALESIPSEFCRPLRQFQIHQFRDGSFELRVVAVSPLRQEFEAHLRAAWATLPGADAAPLRIIRVDSIPRGPGGKFQDFSSDFMPAMDTGEQAESPSSV
ncbi:MAG: AMP-binding protein [Rhodocyclales bacterium]|nr:AMP-binding protein [Rhodocyclales bacterium]